MSDHIPDDEALSAHLDGEGDVETAEHLGSCAACAARLDELRVAAAAVGAPVEPRPDGQRAAAVNAALAAAADEIPSARRRVPPWLAAAAAALVLVLAAVPIVLSQRESNDEIAQRTAGGSSQDASEGAIATPPEDIGAQSDPQALARLLDERMRAPRPVPGAALSAEAASDDRERTTDGGAGATGGAAAGATAAPPCLTEAREAGANKVGALLYTGLLEWNTTPAVVHVFQAPDPQAATLTRRAFVMARSDCQLLVAPSF